MDLEKLKKDQLKLAEKVLLTDKISSIKRVAAADQAYIDTDTVIGVIVVYDTKTMEEIDRNYSVHKCMMQYIPSFLSYREAPAFIEAYSKLKDDFDILIVEGNGILHPRRIGIASHVGIAINKPTIGVAKSLLCGEERENSIYINKEVVGKVIKPHEHTKPFYVSPGHLISLQKSYEIVKGLIQKPYKLPYPLAMANKYAKKVRAKISESG